MDIDKKIAEWEEVVTSESVIELSLALNECIDQLKECRELVKSYEKWTSDLKFPACPLCGMTPRSVEQHTKEDGLKAAWEWYTESNFPDVEKKKALKQAIDSVGGSHE